MLCTSDNEVPSNEVYVNSFIFSSINYYLRNSSKPTTESKYSRINLKNLGQQSTIIKRLLLYESICNISGYEIWNCFLYVKNPLIYRKQISYVKTKLPRLSPFRMQWHFRNKNILLKSLKWNLLIFCINDHCNYA